MKKNLICGLGAKDPEMQEIENILAEHHIECFYAKVKDQRVCPSNCYQADPPIPIPKDRQLVMIECGFSSAPDLTSVIIDHHKLGDPGYAEGSNRFWEGSSIGQLHKLLEIDPGHNAVVIAALDHCFAAAVRGECRGVTPTEVIKLRFKELSKQTGTSTDEVYKTLARYKEELKYAPIVGIGNQEIKDFRGRNLGESYSIPYQLAQLAVVMNREAALLRSKDPVSGLEKCFLTGHTTKDTVEAFMNVWAPEQGFTQIFGNPNRGYAGGSGANEIDCLMPLD